ncbi:hydroxymethylglutaryl-CoA lyase [Aliiruegeria sabulilitoris]|uniref:hydroxymethylglutaryl-CoA lyase n=1 Tax=Aliiruegeria sabulilitoris TaxID=1510458 RepID=UPI000831A2C4|nr:hydroxymethylglutaryl-CoA lyase [Aliiruegeria sabulilitoris]NDR56409.1 hydroxymethylglutaryl-CoA lyase [Pseudoruegeria sp. M32A2M]
MTDRVEIFEVGPRDGLQNEPRPIPTTEKVALVDCLSAAGFARIEVASFVSPKWVPQMADSAEVLARIARADGVSYTALVPNLQGLERAIEARADEVAVFVSASEGFSRANLNCSVAESFARITAVVAGAQAAGLKVRGYVSCVTDCPFDGPTPPGQVARVAARLADLGCYEVSLGDTIGQARSETLRPMLEAVTGDLPTGQLAGHYHDTGGRALDNIALSLDFGIRVFDAAVGGLGGCPYAPGAEGNVATEAVIARLAELGVETGLDAEIVAQAAGMARAMRGRRE